MVQEISIGGGPGGTAGPPQITASPPGYVSKGPWAVNIVSWFFLPLGTQKPVQPQIADLYKWGELHQEGGSTSKAHTKLNMHQHPYCVGRVATEGGQ